MIYIFDFYYSDKSYLRYICFTKSARAVTWNPFFDFFKKISRDSLVTDLEGYNGFPQINIPFKFSRINHRPLAIMDGCSKCCEINTVSLTYGSLQVLPWNNDSVIEKMYGWKWCHHITDFFQYMLPEIKDISKLSFMIYPCCNSCSAKTQQIWKNAWLQLLFYNKKGASRHRMDGYNWNYELALKKGMTGSACFKETQYPNHDKWRPETMTVPLKCMAASALSK